MSPESSLLMGTAAPGLKFSERANRSELTTQVSGQPWSSFLQLQQERLLECIDDPAHEPGGVGAVDHAVIVREG